MAGRVVAIAYLMFLTTKLSFAEDIAAQLKQMNQRMHDIELRDQLQTDKIAELERELESSTKLNIELQLQQHIHEETIRDLIRNVEELKRTTADRAEASDELDSDSAKPVTDTPKGDYRGLYGSLFNMESGPNPLGHGIRKGTPSLDEIPTRRGQSLRAVPEQVAFSATLTPHDYGPLGKGQTIHFDSVLTNVGNAYHAHSGIFTAPLGGVYVFHVTISGWQKTADHHYLAMLVNGVHRCSIWALNTDQSSQLLVLNLNQSDEVYITNGVASDTILGATYSSFSGFLLFPLENVVVGK